uniref:Uncharacterized protein n=1 Tax=Oncorhynchus mykiss TaxID=8022 RepID=A0A8C7R6Q6_ONCMY
HPEDTQSRRFCFMSPYLTCFLSSDRMSLGCAVSGSRVTSTVKRNTHFIRINKINITIWGTAFYCSVHYFPINAEHLLADFPSLCGPTHPKLSQLG